MPRTPGHISPRVVTVPNAFTLVRLLAATVAAGLFLFTEAAVTGVALCCGGMVLDAVDGWWARRFDAQSCLGVFMDPLADKILMAVVYGVLVAHSSSPEAWTLFALVTARDIGVTVSRVRRMRLDDLSPANGYGKVKMVLQSAAGAAMMGYSLVWRHPLPTGLVTAVLAVVAVLSLLSARQYWVPSLSFGTRATPGQSRH